MRPASPLTRATPPTEVRGVGVPIRLVDAPKVGLTSGPGHEHPQSASSCPQPVLSIGGMSPLYVSIHFDHPRVMRPRPRRRHRPPGPTTTRRVEPTSGACRRDDATHDRHTNGIGHMARRRSRRLHPPRQRCDVGALGDGGRARGAWAVASHRARRCSTTSSTFDPAVPMISIRPAPTPAADSRWRTAPSTRERPRSTASPSVTLRRRSSSTSRRWSASDGSRRRLAAKSDQIPTAARRRARSVLRAGSARRPRPAQAARRRSSASAPATCRRVGARTPHADRVHRARRADDPLAGALPRPAPRPAAGRRADRAWSVVLEGDGRAWHTRGRRLRARPTTGRGSGSRRPPDAPLHLAPARPRADVGPPRRPRGRRRIEPPRRDSGHQRTVGTSRPPTPDGGASFGAAGHRLGTRPYPEPASGQEKRRMWTLRTRPMAMNAVRVLEPP